jgi:hypothetical protein
MQTRTIINAISITFLVLIAGIASVDLPGGF